MERTVDQYALPGFRFGLAATLSIDIWFPELSGPSFPRVIQVPLLLDFNPYTRVLYKVEQQNQQRGGLVLVFRSNIRCLCTHERQCHVKTLSDQPFHFVGYLTRCQRLLYEVCYGTRPRTGSAYHDCPSVHIVLPKHVPIYSLGNAPLQYCGPSKSHDCTLTCSRSSSCTLGRIQ